MIQDHPKCVTCINRVLSHETFDNKQYTVSRCKANDATKAVITLANGKPRKVTVSHPFGHGASGPVLTCREMLYNACKDFKLRSPIKGTDAKQDVGVARAHGQVHHSGSSKSSRGSSKPVATEAA